MPTMIRWSSDQSISTQRLITQEVDGMKELLRQIDAAVPRLRNNIQDPSELVPLRTLQQVDCHGETGDRRIVTGRDRPG